jgi:hypothetical protein
MIRHMMPNGICIGFFKTSQLEISAQDAILIMPALQYVGGLMILKHWNFHLTAPAVQNLDHLRCFLSASLYSR